MTNPTFAKLQPQSPRGFTLIELLITITIIAVLLALALAGFNKARKSADQVQSIRNISQLQVANASYAADHNGKYVPWTSTDADGKGVPGSTYWMWNYDFLRSYRGEPVLNHENECPLSMLDGVTARAKKKGYDSLDSSYGYNVVNLPNRAKPGDGWMGKDAHPGYSVFQVTNPSQSAAFITATDMRASNINAWWTNPRVDGVEGRTNSGTIAYRHNGKCLVVFYDGHVVAKTWAEMKEVTPAGGNLNNIPFWNAGFPNVYQ